MEKTKNISYILLGGNLDDVKGTFEKARIEISKKVGVISKESSLYQSKSWGFASDDPFLNQVLEVRTILSAKELLKNLLAIETKLGRVRDSKILGYTSRLIDLDILYFNDEIINLVDLNIPHKSIQDRKFTLLPLVDIIPDFVHPINKKTNIELLKICSDTNSVNKI